MQIPVPAFIKEIDPYVPGKPLEEVEREYGITDSVKLASNENPLGPSPKAMAAIRDAVAELHRYPDGSGFHLVRAIAGHLKVPAETVVPGNGSDEVIGMVVRAFMQAGENAVMPKPAFLMYDILVKTMGGVSRPVPLSGMEIDLDGMLSAIDEKTRVVFVTTPNNPTGRVIGRDALLAFLDRIPEAVCVVVDEAYIEFADPEAVVSGVTLWERYPNLVTLRTFSKAYGLAGLRIGYGICHPDVAGYLHRVRQPFNVNGLAQVGAVAALEDAEFLEKTLALTREGKTWFYGEMERLGLSYHPSEANFFLVEVGGDAKAVFEAMLKEGVIVRAMNSYLFPTCIRLTIGTPEENRKCVDALERVLANLKK